MFFHLLTTIDTSAMKYYSVKLESLIGISDRALKIKTYDGREHIIPKSQILGYDYERGAYWISAWIVESKGIQHSPKHWSEFSKNGRKIPQTEIHHHIPNKINNDIEYDTELFT